MIASFTVLFSRLGGTASAFLVVIATVLFCRGPVLAGNHGDSPATAQDSAAAIGDVFLFLDPNDNTKAILACTVHSFTVPSFDGNFGFFDPTVRLRFQINNTNDATPSAFIDVTFSSQVNQATPQTATIALTGIPPFTAPTTLSTPTPPSPANPPVVTTDAVSGISFFAGLTDDPFFFDLPAALRYVVSRQANATNPALLTRGRDSFAGYNINTVALRVPVSLIRGAPTNHLLGLCVYAQRLQTTILTSGTGFNAIPAPVVKPQVTPATTALAVNSDGYVSVDRMGNPGINTFLISFKNNDAYDRATTVDDANGVFASDFVANLQALQSDATSIGILANLVVVKGDMLRMDLNVANTGTQGGTNPEAAFPNGRRPTDQVMNTLFTLINNRVFQDVGVDANDVGFRNAFPFFAAPEEPFPAGTINDLTRN